MCSIDIDGPRSDRFGPKGSLQGNRRARDGPGLQLPPNNSLGVSPVNPRIDLIYSNIVREQQLQETPGIRRRGAELGG